MTVALNSPECLVVMGSSAGCVVVVGHVTSMVFTRVVGHLTREQARRGMDQQDPDVLPEQ
jgi:hypothetical protein